MEINCPSCNEAVLIADEDMTTTIECPFCQQPIEFDEPEPPPVKDVPPPVELPPPVSDEARRVLTSKLLTLCPACGKAVSKQADICLDCGHPIYRGALGKAWGLSHNQRHRTRAARRLRVFLPDIQAILGFEFRFPNGVLNRRPRGG